ncbi:hypothetical protein C8J57DRAFT_1495527 [Mycena rebaudengoi]|nr:hypothetical protein C8J57DRAFT_1495527 [Mycena rebaudengoi]
MSLGERCDTCGSTTTLSAISPVVPRIEIEALDTIPFSESFTGLFDDERDVGDDNESLDDEPERDHHDNNMSYNVEQFSNIQYLDAEWDDEDVEEVMVLSPKQSRYSALSTISEERETLGHSCPASCSSVVAQIDSTVTLADFDILPASGYPMLCRKRSTNKVMEAVNALDTPFLDRVHWSFVGVGDADEGRVYLVLESHGGGNLLDLVNSQRMTASDALFYACEIVDGVHSLHGANIIHRALTPSNIIVDNTGHIVLCNFSSAVFVSSSQVQGNKSPSAAIENQAPEVLLGWGHDFAVDCWSLGILLHFLLAGKNPFESEHGSLVTRILNGALSVSDELEPEAKDLIVKCLERNPALRLKIRDIKTHAYFASVDWGHVQLKGTQIFLQAQLPRLRQNCDPPARTFLFLPLYGIPKSSTLRSTRHLPSTQQAKLCLRSPASSDTTLVTPLLPDRAELLQWKTCLPRHGIPGEPKDAGPSLAPMAAAVYSPRLSLQIQTPDSLPKIFKSIPLFDQPVQEEEQSPAISSPTICELSPRERMSLFWERLDAEDNEPGSSVATLELRDALRLALPCPPLPTPRPRKLRKRPSSEALPQIYSQSEQRFSIFSATQGTNKLRKLRRPISTPLLRKRPDPIPNLPQGLEQIGKGIGYTYKVPPTSCTKASICTTGNGSAAGRLFRGGFGLLRRAKSYPRLPSSHNGDHQCPHGAQSPPTTILISPNLTAAVPPTGMNSPVSDSGPLTPDSIAFPLPEAVGSDPFAKDDVSEENRDPGMTLRLVRMSSTEYRLPFSPGMQPLDNFIFSSWDV